MALIEQCTVDLICFSSTVVQVWQGFKWQKHLYLDGDSCYEWMKEVRGRM